jgi:AcrR family transcriptional regulator
MKRATRPTYTMVARAETTAGTRERIVHAALKLMLEQAYEDITLVAIAEAADVSHQTVLNHFESKENVAAAAAELLSRQTQAARDEAVPDDQAGAIAILVAEYERFGDAGIALRRTAHPAAIAAAVRRILKDPAYRAAAQQLGQSVRRDADSAALVRELEDVTEERERSLPVDARRVS